MFEELRARRRIVVTGPQRSGTRIATKMIAADTGHRYIDELDFAIHDAVRWRAYLSTDDVVVHAPSMLKDVVDDPPPGIFVVLMRRSLEAIHASAVRIDWEGQHQGNSYELRKFGLPDGDSAEVKYEYWDAHHKRFPYSELPYESLRGHPLWVDEALRSTFGPLQTAP
jgi:hypothetical protein